MEQQGTKKLAGWMGSTSYAAKEGRGDHPGCTAMTFYSVKAYNKYFEKHPGLLVIEEHFIPMFFGLLTKVIIMVTNQLTEVEAAEFNEVSREVEFAMAERRKVRAEAKEKEESEGRAKEQEDKRLIEVGHRYEARVKHMKSLPAGSETRKATEKLLNAGDPEVLNAMMEGTK